MDIFFESFGYLVVRLVGYMAGQWVQLEFWVRYLVLEVLVVLVSGNLWLCLVSGSLWLCCSWCAGFLKVAAFGLPLLLATGPNQKQQTMCLV